MPTSPRSPTPRSDRRRRRARWSRRRRSRRARERAGRRRRRSPFGSTGAASRGRRRAGAMTDRRPTRTPRRRRRERRRPRPGRRRTQTRQARSRTRSPKAVPSQSRRAPRRWGARDRSQGFPPAEAAVDPVVVADDILAEAPAQEDLLAVELAGEVDQPGVGVAQQDAARRQVLDLGLQRLLVSEPVGTGDATAVGCDRFGDAFARRDEAEPRVTQPREALAKLGKLRVRVGHREHSVGRHATARTSDGSSRRSLIRVHSASGYRSRRSIRTGVIPSAAVGATSNSGLSPTYIASLAASASRSNASSKIRGSGFSMPSRPLITRTPNRLRTPSVPSRSSSHASKLDTIASTSPPVSSSSSVGSTSSNNA